MAEAKKTTKKVTEEEIKDGTDQETSDVTSQATNTEKVEPKATAKAGKRSAKAVKEAEEKQAKEERKAHETEEASAPKPAQKPARTRLERRGKNYRKTAEQIEVGKQYTLVEAIDLAKKTSPVKFDASLELHVRLGVDPRQADQNIRDSVVLPAGTGKTIRIAVFADPENAAKAKTAGADITGSDEFLQQLDKGTVDFDVLIATPSVMPKLGKYARLLGPKGLMPNPKSGTVTQDVAKAVKEAKAGRVEYRVDSTGIVHVAFGKVSFDSAKLLQNLQAVTGSIKNARPTGLKGTYVKSVFVSTSMGPSIAVALAELN